MGQSRSVSYIAAWAMLRFKIDLIKLLDVIDKKRHGANVNIGFLSKLGMLVEGLGMNNMVARGSGSSGRKRKISYLITGGRALLLKMDEVCSVLKATNFVDLGYKYKNEVFPVKLLQNGRLEKIVKREDGTVTKGVWQSTVLWEKLGPAKSKAKNFNAYAYIIGVDGKK